MGVVVNIKADYLQDMKAAFYRHIFGRGEMCVLQIILSRREAAMTGFLRLRGRWDEAACILTGGFYSLKSDSLSRIS